MLIVKDELLWKEHKMSMGNNIAERSQKRNTITEIQCNMVLRMSLERACEQTKDYNKKKLAELKELRKVEFETYSDALKK